MSQQFLLPPLLQPAIGLRLVMLILAVALLLLASASAALAQTRDSVVILAGATFPAALLQEKIEGLPIDSAVAKLRQFYFQEGFLDAEIQREGNRVQIQEGKAYRFGKVKERLIAPDSLPAISTLDSLVLQGQRYRSTTLEELLRQRPEVILIDQNQLRYLTELQALHTLPAMRDGRVFGLRGEVLSSARLGLALRSYAERIHPRSVLP